MICSHKLLKGSLFIKTGFFKLKKSCKCFLIWLLFLPNVALCGIHEISDIFIEGVGNNKYEAKIKAHEAGMMRAFLLVADSMEIKSSALKQVPYKKLKDSFNPSKVSDEFSTDEKYSATITYQYDKVKFYQLLLGYGEKEIKEMFFETLILPVFKQKNILNIWRKEEKWNDIWRKSKKELNDHNILYPTTNFLVTKKITQKNLFNLRYDDFIEIFPNKFFKNVVIITAEFFTNRYSKETIMQVRSYVLYPGKQEAIKLEDTYKLLSLDDISHNVNLTIDKVINRYGSLRAKQNVKLDDPEINLIEENLKKGQMVMYFDAHTLDEKILIVNKLKKIKEICSFSIEQERDTRYKLTIFSDSLESDLAENFYLNGLSYRISDDNLYNLIDVKKGR